jgi:predicted CXXCH cytochrome family protein
MHFSGMKMYCRGIRNILMSVVFILVFFQTSLAVTDHSKANVMNRCRSCHRRALPTHAMESSGKTPQGWQRGSRGEMLCITCHDCTSGICRLRETTTELCNSCHDCTKGMACLLGVAHLGNAIKKGSRRGDCISCHDGSLGKDVRTQTMGTHKVDVYYIKKKGYNSRLDRRIILPEGKVTCISCHNPYKNERGRLVMSNERSSLCLSCHIK